MVFKAFAGARDALHGGHGNQRGGLQVIDSIFWAATGIITLFVAGILVRALRRSTAGTPTDGFDGQVYRDQLSEIERDSTRGVIADDEAKRLRSEVARRLLAADRADDAADAAKPGPRSVPVLGVMALVLAAGFGGYAYLGQPGYGDLPLKARIAEAEKLRADRPNQAALEAALPPQPQLEAIDPEFLALVEKLRAAVAQRPEDLQGQQLLARNEANLGNLIAAYKAQEQVIALKGDKATDADILTLATLMFQAADGQVSPEVESLLQAVLKRDKRNDTALFFIGILNMQIGRYDLAFRYWQEVIDTAPAGSPWLAEARSRIVPLAEVVGVRYVLPDAPAATPGMTPELSGPSAADVQAAQDMTPEDRQAMIRSMVEGLNDRLATEGGTAEEWARLISVLANLGENERAAVIFAEAQKNFAGRDAELAVIQAAAAQAGLAP